jgi:V-type H+-transporting ATPase subunit F
MIREKVNTYKEIMPALLEIPSKEHPYDPDKDAVLQRVNRLSATD